MITSLVSQFSLSSNHNSLLALPFIHQPSNFYTPRNYAPTVLCLDSSPLSFSSSRILVPQRDDPLTPSGRNFIHPRLDGVSFLFSRYPFSSATESQCVPLPSIKMVPPPWKLFSHDPWLLHLHLHAHAYLTLSRCLSALAAGVRLVATGQLFPLSPLISDGS